MDTKMTQKYGNAKTQAMSMSFNKKNHEKKQKKIQNQQNFE
jgi:hypothetical protein